MSNELEASKLISESLDRELNPAEQERMSRLLETSERARNVKRMMETVRAIASNPETLEANGLKRHESLSVVAQERIEDAVSTAIENRQSRSESVSASRQLRDVAFASVLIGSGKVTERDLVSAIDDWTAYGNESLVYHLTASGLIDAEEAASFESVVDEALKDTVTGYGSGDDTGADMATSLRESLVKDEGSLARIAGILGLGHMTAGANELDYRRVGAEYNLIRKLAQGGLGSVWLARDEKLKRNVALKEIAKDGSASDSTIQRFRREAQVTGQLEHPNIVSVYQFGEDEATGKLFYAMRFVGKKTLREAIAEYHERIAVGMDTTNDLSKLLGAFQTVCQAVAFAHSRGVIHRDLKPENVALDAFGQVIVLDWGLAKVFGEPEYFDLTEPVAQSVLGDAERTVAGQVLGTPHYMSPEQAAGRIDDIDERTDVYGLGAILFAILTGQAPHAFVSSGSTSIRVDELLSAIVKEPTPAVQSANCDVSPELATICQRAMAKQKYTRYSSAAELADAVQDWTAGVAKRTQVFEEMKAATRELEVRLSGTAKDIIRNARFVSSLPPIQGIIDANRARDTCDPVEVWQRRLETILAELLRANTEMMSSITFLQVEGNTAHELVRVERHVNDLNFIRSTPNSRLSEWDAPELVTAILETEPGDTEFSIIQSPRKSIKRRSRRHHLTATLPIFDQDNGELFGFVAIETDMARTIKNAVDSLQTTPTSVVVVDTTGLVCYSVHGGTEFAMKLDSKDELLSRYPKLADAVDSDKRVVDDGGTFVARRVLLGDAEISVSLFVIASLERAH